MTDPGEQRLSSTILRAAVEDVKTGRGADLESALRFIFDDASSFELMVAGLGHDVDVLRQGIRRRLEERFEAEFKTAGTSLEEALTALLRQLEQPTGLMKKLQQAQHALERAIKFAEAEGRPDHLPTQAFVAEARDALRALGVVVTQTEKESR